MTYRNKIQQMIATINKIYGDAETMRDVATDEEKDYWNQLRTLLYDAPGLLKRLDHRLTSDRATIKVRF